VLVAVVDDEYQACEVEALAAERTDEVQFLSPLETSSLSR
jgi:hypothetical protein